MTNLRVGQGYDVHRLVEGRPLILGGIQIPHTLGLLGHSDADVLTHAIMDALLGAVGLGDIGQWFPDNDDAFLNADSIELLTKVSILLKDRGFSVVNIDATLVAQKPKVMPYLSQMKEKIAMAVGILPSQVNLKATTEERLGFTGEEKGMAAQAIALIEKE